MRGHHESGTSATENEEREDSFAGGHGKAPTVSKGPDPRPICGPLTPSSPGKRKDLLVNERNGPVCPSSLRGLPAHRDSPILLGHGVCFHSEAPSLQEILHPEH